MGEISETDIPWQELRQVCKQSIEMAQDLGHYLRRGSAGPQLQPLLEESAELFGQLRRGIRNLASRSEKIDSARYNAESRAHQNRPAPTESNWI